MGKDKNSMGDIMTLTPFRKLVSWILEESKKEAVFGIKRPPIAGPDKIYGIFDRELETSSGPAAGSHTQLTQNIVASYVVGSRFFKLKTAQKLDGKDLPASKPCIKADDEYYNCGWSTELYVLQALDGYIKVWFVCKVLAREHDLGNPDGFQFNMFVGYNLDGIKTEKTDRFVKGMKGTSETAALKGCRQWLFNNLDGSEEVSREGVEATFPSVYDCAALSTLHGRPPQEIERIARYLTEEKKVHMFIKCNPTLLGYRYVKKIMDDMGYDHVAFGDSHFKDDLQYRGVVPMFQRLRALTDEKSLEFGVKIISIFLIDIEQNELLSEEICISGKFPYPLSMFAAKMLTEDFGGRPRISYSGGVDFFNIADIVDADI